MIHEVTFPGLGISLSLNRVAFSVLGHPIYWYGIIIAAGFLLAVSFCYRRARSFGIEPDSLLDMLLYAVPLAILGARLYYIIFYLDLYRTAEGGLDWGAMVRIWDGGLAIYGGVIAAVLTLYVFCRRRKIKFGAFADLGCLGLLIGQAVGRWGNFMNAEAYGGPTTLPWRMGLVTARGFQEVHPTFLYESLWNLVGLILLLVIARRWRKFDSQLFLSYILWYGLGRTWIEGLRSDSLYFFGLTLFGAPIRTSQALALLSALAALGLLIYHLSIKKHSPQELYVNQIKHMEVTKDDDPGREDIGGENQE